MKDKDIYTMTLGLVRKGNNQPVEMTLADLIDELEKANAIAKDTAWQMRLAIMHHDLA